MNGRLLRMRDPLERAGGVAKRIALGTRTRKGLLITILVYALLISIGYVYLYPLLFMIANSFKDLPDLINPLVRWIPTEFYTGNYTRAFRVLDYWPVLFETIIGSLLPALAQTAVAALVGYGFSRFRFPLRGLWFTLVLLTFVIPPQVTMIPEFLMYDRLNLLNTVYAMTLPAILGQGIRSAIFVLIFFQFTKSMPRALEEAALVDGAGPLKAFLRIVVPMAVPALLVSFLFSFVWYWNETYLTNLYVGSALRSLPRQLSAFAESFRNVYPQGAGVEDQLNEAINMAGTMLTILPVLVIYFILQKWFVEGVDRTGVTGE